MPALPRPSRLFLLFSYLALSAVPVLPLLLGRPVQHAGQLLALELMAWAALWSIFKRPAGFHWLLLPAFLLLPVEVYLQVFFGQPLAPHHLGIMAETSPGEAIEFLGGKAWGVAAVALASLLWWALTYAAALRQESLAWNGRARTATLALSAALAAVAAYCYEFGIEGAHPGLKEGWGAPYTGAHHLGKSGLPPFPYVVRMAADAGFEHTRPFGLTAVFASYIQARRDLAALAGRAASFRFHASQRPGSAPQTVVVVIGESSRFDRWSLNGYARPTNPWLSQQDNLVMLSNVVSPVSATRLSVPLIVTRKPAAQSMQDGFAERSLVGAFREAGYRSWWLSNQLVVGEFDTPVSAIAREADDVQFLNLGTYNEQSSFDDVLLAPLKRALASPAQHQLVVLHTLGSHWNYGRRYPAQFDQWRPSLHGVEGPQLEDSANQLLASNSYDNSIRYTDWFLSQVIGQLKQQGRSSVLLYVSDHGETLRTEGCRKFLHGQGTRNEFHVPALAWYSSQYRERHPEKVAQLERHRAAPLVTSDFFHTVLDAAGIRYPDEHLEWSFLQQGYTPRQRLVSNNDGAWIDYDTAEGKGACQVLVAPARIKQASSTPKDGIIRP